MFIVTYQELDQRNDYWQEGAYLFNSKEEAVEFMADCHEMMDRFRDIRLWDAKEIKYKAEVKATITLEE